MSLSPGESTSTRRMAYWGRRFGLRFSRKGGGWKGSWLKDSPALPAMILLTGIVAGVSLYAWLDANRAASEEARLSADVARLEIGFARKLDVYDDELRGAAAYLSFVNRIDQPAWR